MRTKASHRSSIQADTTNETTGALRRYSWLFLGLILFIACALRLYRLEDVSLWIDDFGYQGYAGAEDLGNYFSLVRGISPDHMPGFFFLQYLWGIWISNTEYSLRLMTVFLSVLTVLLVYLLAKRLYSKEAGYIAAAFAAISPFQMWYGQTMRNNAFIVCLVLLAMLSLLKAAQGGKKSWWLVNVITNIVLVWTHLLSCIFLFCQGLFLLFAWRVPFRKRFSSAFIWTLFISLFLLPVPFWLEASQGYLLTSAEDYYFVSWWNLLVDILGDDAVSLSQPWMFFFHPSKHIMANPYEAFIQGQGLNAWLNRLWTTSVAALLVASVFIYLRSRLSKLAPAQESGEGTALLLILILVPACLLFTLSRFIYPCMQPQYTLASLSAIHIVAGGVLVSIPQRALRLSAVIALLGLLTYQLALILPGETRFNWEGAAREIRAQARENDLVLVRGRFLSREVFRCVLAEERLPVVRATSLKAALLKSEAYFNAEDLDPQRQLWIVAQVAFDYPKLPLKSFETQLSRNGLRWRREDYYGAGGIVLYQLQQGIAPQPQEISTEEWPAATVDFAQLIRDMDFSFETSAKESACVAFLELFFEGMRPKGPMQYVHAAWTALDEGYTGFSRILADKAIGMRPKTPMAHLIRAIALAEEGDLDAAESALHSAITIDGIGLIKRYKPLFYALYIEPEPVLAQKEFERLEKRGAYLPDTFRLRCAEIPFPETLQLKSILGSSSCPTP